MKPVFFFVSLLFFAAQLKAQQIPPPPLPPPPSLNLPVDSFKTIQVEAYFPGGQAAWTAFLTQHMKTNTPAKHHAPSGNYTVTASFLVDTSGKVTEITILVDPGYGCAEDVKRVLQKSPDWIPATENGKPVIYRQKQRVTYQVE